MPAGSPDKVKWGSEVTSKRCRVRRQNFGFVAGAVCRRLTRKEGPPYNENSFVSQLRLFDLASTPMPQTRPDHLEEFIRSLVCECRGVYAPDFDRVKRSVGYAEEDLCRYLGTYYPRSLLETYDIASELFRKIFGTEVRTDGELKILDLGCGLGGASAGLLYAVLERFGVRKVSVDGFDANEASLRTFERILASESFALARAELRRLEAPGAQAEVVVRLKRARIDSERFDLLGDESRYDVILTSKMLNELPVERKYFRFLETYLPHLAQNGLCFVIDVNDRREGRYISQRLSEETLAFLGRHDGFECLLPPGCRDCAKRGLPCGGFNQFVCRESNFDRLNPLAARGVSKVCCRVFCRSPLYRHFRPKLTRFDFLASEAGGNHVYCPRLHS